MKKTMMLLAVIAITATVMFALTVDGFVTDADTGEPIEGATVRFVYIDGGGTGGCGGGGGNGYGGGNGGGNGNCGGNGVNVYTNEDGYYIITDLEPGIYNAMARKHASYPAVHIYDVEILDDTSIDFELTGGNCVPPVRLFHQKQSQINK